MGGEKTSLTESEEEYHAKSHFPKAFETYKKTIDIKEKKITTFQQLLTSFKEWGKKRTPMTQKQLKALAIEGKREGIEPIKKVGWIKEIKTVPIAFEGWKNVLTGRFTTEKGDVPPPTKYKGYKIVYVKTPIIDESYGGINYYAWKHLGGYRRVGKKSIHIVEGQSKTRTVETIKHEYNEAEMMRKNPQYSYPYVHRVIMEKETRRKRK